MNKSPALPLRALQSPGSPAAQRRTSQQGRPGGAGRGGGCAGNAVKTNLREDGGHEERTSWGPGRKQRVRSGRQGVLGVPAPEVHDMRPAGPAASSVEQQPRTEDCGCAVVFIYFHAGDNLLRSLRPRWLTLPPPVPKWESPAGGLLGRPFCRSSLSCPCLRLPHRC